MHVGPGVSKEREKREEILVGHRLTTIYRSIRQAFFHETLHAVILHMPPSRFVTCIRSNMEPMSYDRSTSRGSSYRLRIESSETLFCASGNIEPCHSLVVSPQPHHRPCRSQRHPQLFRCSPRHPQLFRKTLFPRPRCSWTSGMLFLMGRFVNVVSQSVSGVTRTIG